MRECKTTYITLSYKILKVLSFNAHVFVHVTCASLFSFLFGELCLQVGDEQFQLFHSCLGTIAPSLRF